MSVSIPRRIAYEVKALVYDAADQHFYLSKSRTENNIFLNSLVKRTEIGGVLRQFMEDAAVRTYIKDGILNRYSKDKNQELKPSRYEDLIQETYGMDVTQIENSKDISVYKSIETKTFVIVAHGSYLKWETALRKALIYIASKPFGNSHEYSSKIMLSLFAAQKSIPPSDIKCLRDAIARCDATAILYGES